MVSRYYRTAALIVLWVLCGTLHAAAQAQPDTATTSPSFLRKNITFTGEAGAYGEVYSMSGGQDRRPASTGRLYLRPTLTLFRTFSIPMEFFVSTEGSGARQDINRYGIAPSWEWGKLSLGDFSETYSDLTLSGINVRGAGVNLFPGAFRFALAAGVTQREVEGGAENGSHDRFLAAIKTGIGNEDASHFYLTVLKAKDNIPAAGKPVNALKMVFPNGSDEIPINTFQTIKWYTSGSTQNVNILLSTDAGSSFVVIAANTPNSGFYNWYVSNVAETFSAVIKIVDAADSTIQTSSEFPFRIGFGIDTKIGMVPAGIANAFAVTPQENLLVGVNTQVNFLNDMFKIGIEGVGSAYTKDLTADAVNIDSVDIPSFVRKFYSPRTSTNVDYAVTSFLSFNANRVSARVGYKYIGPGYNSLGLSYLINDQREFTGMASVNLFPVTVFMNYGRVNDNLINQKLFTTVRNQYGMGVSAFASALWSTSALVNFLDMGNNSSNDTTRTDFTNMMLSLNNNFTFGESALVKNVSVNYSFQNAINTSYLMKNNASTANSVNVTAGFEPVQNLTSTLSLGFVNSVVMDTITTFSQNYSVSAGYPLFDAKMQNMLSVTASIQEGNTAFNVMFNSSYAVTQVDYLTLQVGTNTYTANTPGVNNFTEMRTSINYSHRF